MSDEVTRLRESNAELLAALKRFDPHRIGFGWSLSLHAYSEAWKLAAKTIAKIDGEDAEGITMGR